MDLYEEIKKIEAKITNLRFQLAVEEKVLTRLKAYQTSDQTEQSSSGISSSMSRRTFQGSVTGQIESILTMSNKPMTTVELAEEIKQQGNPKDLDKLKILIASAIHRRTDIFARVKRGVYDLKSRQKEMK